MIHKVYEPLERQDLSIPAQEMLTEELCFEAKVAIPDGEITEGIESYNERETKAVCESARDMIRSHGPGRIKVTCLRDETGKRNFLCVCLYVIRGKIKKQEGDE